MINIYLFWLKSEISKKLIESNKSITQLIKIYIYIILKNLQSLKKKNEMENYLQDAYSFIISLIKKICII